MKKYGCAVLLMLLPALLCGCISPNDPIIESLPPYQQRSMESHGTFQDYTDYGKFQYSGVTPEILDSNPNFQKVLEWNMGELTAYLENFRQWVALTEGCEDCELHSAFDFSEDFLREGDYYCVINDYAAEQGQRKYSDYTIYYFSVENQTLYYFHNNI